MTLQTVLGNLGIAWQKFHAAKSIKLITTYNFDLEIIVMGCSHKHFKAEISVYYTFIFRSYFTENKGYFT